MVQVRHKSIGNYSGPVIYGPEYNIASKRFGLDIKESHLDRAVFLTALVETGGRIGSIMAADGTAMSAGLGQHILVYPRELANEDFNAEDDQGGLGRLLRMLEVSQEPPMHLQALFTQFEVEGWYLAQDGFLRWREAGSRFIKGERIKHSAGDIIHGAILRDRITPIHGKVKARTENWLIAKRWATLFHNVFADPKSIETQLFFEKKHLAERVASRKFLFRKQRRRMPVQDVVYGDSISSLELPERAKLCQNPVKCVTLELDLAMCVFHSHTVNAPSIAYRVMRDAIGASGFIVPGDRMKSNERIFAKTLLRMLATSNYGRWNQSIMNGRWRRTRKLASHIGVWPEHYFTGSDAIMPSTFRD